MADQENDQISRKTPKIEPPTRDGDKLPGTDGAESGPDAPDDPLAGTTSLAPETSRIGVDAAEGGDSRKGDTARVSGVESTPSGKTPTTKRPETVVLKKTASSPSSSAPKPGVISGIVAPDSSSGEGHTARVEVPPEAMSSIGRPKTIKIKRADSTAARVAAKPEVRRRMEVSVETSPGQLGTLVAVCTIISIVIVLVLVYVLAAQTILPNLPWPGRLVPGGPV